MLYRRLSYSMILIGLMLIAIVPSALFINGARAGQPWWNSSWNYRKSVTITSAASLSNYDVLITTDTQSLILSGKMKADGSDIRFIDSSNNLLPYWIESPTINTTTTRIWVNATSISTSGTTVWMYYGNSAATATSNGVSTFSFFDDDWASITGQGYNPVHTATQSWWESTCSYPNVFYDASFSGRGPYQMLFDGHNVIGNAKGYAYSPNFIHWTEYDGGSPHPPNANPILGTGYTGNSACAWGDPIKVGSTYYLFYADLGHGKTYRAQSTDLITWTNLTPLNGGSTTISTGAAVLKQGDGITPIIVDGKYWIIYFIADSPGSMYLASSTDLLNWTPWNGNPLLSPTPGGFDSLGLWTPSFVMLNNIYYIYYEAENASGSYQTGYAKANAYNAGNPITPDMATWTKSSDAVLKLGPSGSWDSVYCIDPIIRQFNGNYYLFYTGTSANGFATSASPDGPWTKYNAPVAVWTKGGSPTVSGSIVTLGSGSSLISGSMFSISNYSALGYRANFGGSAQKLKWGGFIAGSSLDRAMITTARTDTNLYLKNYVTAESAAILSGVTLSNFHVYEVLWETGKSQAVVDHGAITSTLTTQVPTKALPVTFYNYEDSTNSLQVDWVFVRPYHDPEPTTIVGSEEQAPSNFVLTVTVIGGGTVSKNPDQTSYADGTVVTLTASASLGWTFASWSGDASGAGNPTSVTMNANKSVTATFTQNTYTLAVSTVGSGSVDLNNSGAYHYGDIVQLTPLPTTGWSFQSWSGDLSGSSNPATLTITGNMAVTATFTQDQYTLGVNVVGDGSVDKNPDQGSYTYGTVVTLTATANLGWAFSSWSGDASGTVSPTTITMTGNKAVTATFTQNEYTLTINTVGSGLVNLNNNGPYHYGDTVQLTAVPSAGWSFDHWSGDLTGSTNPTILTITGNAAVTANFVLPQVYVTPSSVQKDASDVYTTFQTSVMIDKITDLKGFDFDLTWDNNMISLTNVDFNTELDNVWGHGNWYLAYNVSGAGYYELAAVSTSGSFTSTAATPLATLTFIVKAAVGQTSLHFAVVKLSDSQAENIQAEVTDGTYTATSPMYQPVLQITPSMATCRKYHEYFMVQVNVTNAITVESFSFTIYYSPTLMSYVNVSWGELGSGTITNIDQTNGILEGNVAGAAISGNRWLMNITFQDTATMIWKQGQTNELDGQIWFHTATLSFSGIQQLAYQEGGLDQINVNNVAFKFIPIQGDLTNDGIVDITDLRTVAAYFDVKQGDPLWSTASTFDLNSNGMIDIYDLVLVAANFS